MNVSEKNARIWRDEHEGRDGNPFYTYRTSVSKKDESGEYVRTYFDIKFSRKSGVTEPIENGAKCDYSGFMSVRSYKNREGKVVTLPEIIVMEAQFDVDEKDMPDSFEQAQIEIPF